MFHVTALGEAQTDHSSPVHCILAGFHDGVVVWSYEKRYQSMVSFKLHVYSFSKQMVSGSKADNDKMLSFFSFLIFIYLFGCVKP